MKAKIAFLFIITFSIFLISGCTENSRNGFIKAVYDSEPRLDNGHIDTVKLISLIKEHNANTYNYLIGHSEYDWEDLPGFLETACDENIDVWITLTAPGNNPPVPYEDDYEMWGSKIGSISLEYECVKAWSIDNIMMLRGKDADKYIGSFTKIARIIDPDIEFIPVIYMYDLQTEEFDRYKEHFGGIQFYYKLFPNEQGFGGWQEAESQISFARSRFNKKIFLGIYVTPWQKEYPISVSYVEKMIEIGKDDADGIMIYTLQREGEKLRAVKEGFE